MPSWGAQSRNPPCTLFFLAPFAEGFQFYFVTHTTLYRCARKIEGFARDDVAEVAFSQHILYTGRGLSIPPYRHFERSREIFLALCSFLLPSQKVSPFPLSHIRRYTGVQERSLGFARDDVAEAAFSQHILYTGRGLSIFPPTVISSAARNLPCTLLFLAPFAEGFPFSAVSHRTLYQCARKIPPLRSGWQWGWRSALVIFMPPRQRVPLRGTLIQAFGLPLL